MRLLKGQQLPNISQISIQVEESHLRFVAGIDYISSRQRHQRVQIYMQLDVNDHKYLCVVVLLGDLHCTVSDCLDLCPRCMPSSIKLLTLSVGQKRTCLVQSTCWCTAHAYLDRVLAEPIVLQIRWCLPYGIDLP